MFEKFLPLTFFWMDFRFSRNRRLTTSSLRWDKSLGTVESGNIARLLMLCAVHSEPAWLYLWS